MAHVRRTMERLRRLKPRVNRAKIDATTEVDIHRHMIEDGHRVRARRICARGSPTNPAKEARHDPGRIRSCVAHPSADAP
jgi:hypothetical protein